MGIDKKEQKELFILTSKFLIAGALLAIAIIYIIH